MGKTKGVERYTTGTAYLPVFFPNDDIRCQNCRFCRYSDGMRRYWCQLVDRQVYTPFDSIEGFCPIVFQDKEGDE